MEGKRNITLDKSQVKYRRSKKKKQFNIVDELRKIYGDKYKDKKK